jgi:hypothetical protein
MIKHVSASVLSLFLLACSGSSTMSLDQVVSQIQKTCGFVTNAEDIAKVVASLVSGFDSSSGATATVAIGIANTIVESVCGGVKSKAATVGAQTLSASPATTTVTVNGVPVKGHMQDSQGK